MADKELTLEVIERILDKKFDQRLNPMMGKLEDLTAKVSETLEFISFLSEKYDVLTAKVGSLEGQHEDLARDNKILRDEVFTLARNLKSTRTALDDLEQYSRRDCLEIKGIPEAAGENTTDIISNVGAFMDVEVNKEDISISHRLPAPKALRSQPTPRPCGHVNSPTATIIVKFVWRYVRDRFYAARKHLKNKSVADLGIRRSENKIFISESLSHSNKELFKSCLGFKRDFKFKFISTHAGRIYLRKTQDSPAVTVHSLADLDILSKHAKDMAGSEVVSNTVQP